MFYVISVPHATVNLMADTDEHSSDFIAERVSKMMFEKLRGGSVLLVGNINRDIVDLNRKQSRRTVYRETLRRLMRKDCVLIMDVHSFPHSSRNYGGMEIAFVSPKSKPSPIEKSLMDVCDERGIDVSFVPDEDADIYDEAVEHRIPVVLIEFNEKLSEARLATIVEALASAIMRFCIYSA